MPEKHTEEEVDKLEDIARMIQKLHYIYPLNTACPDTEMLEEISQTRELYLYWQRILELIPGKTIKLKPKLFFKQFK